MKVSNRTFDFDHGALMGELDCAVCEGPLSWDLLNEFGEVPAWQTECCNTTYTMKVKSVRVGMSRE